jgi:hypothetical protein
VSRTGHVKNRNEEVEKKIRAKGEVLKFKRRQRNGGADMGKTELGM